MTDVETIELFLQAFEGLEALAEQIELLHYAFNEEEMMPACVSEEEERERSNSYPLFHMPG